MKKKLRRTGLGPKIHPSSTITACPGMEVGNMKRGYAGPDLDSLSIRYQPPGLSRMVSTKLSEKQDEQIPAKLSAFHLSVPGFASLLASFQLLKVVLSTFVKFGLIIYT